MKIIDIDKTFNEGNINIDYRPAQRAAMAKINPANFSNERDYAQAAAAAGNTAGSSAMQGVDLNNPASYAQYSKSAPQPTAAQRAEWSKDATDDQEADWRYGKSPVATAHPVSDPNTKSSPQGIDSVLNVGSTGPEVKVLQKKLGISDDGIYGNNTKNAVMDLQKKLGVTADGAYGPITKAAHEKIAVPTNTVATAMPAAEPKTATPKLANTEELQTRQTELKSQYTTEYKKLQPYIEASKKYEAAIAEVEALIKQTATDSPQYAQLVASMGTAVNGQKSLVDKMNPLVKKIKEIQAEYDSISKQIQTAQPQTESLDRILTFAGLR